MWEQLATNQFDPWQVVPRQVLTPYYRLLISTVFIVVCHAGCLRATSVNMQPANNILTPSAEKQIQQNFHGSNTDGLFTTAVSKSFLSPLEKNLIAADLG